MALVIKDRVKETTTTTGTGTLTLAGAFAGFDSFAEIGNGCIFAPHTMLTGDPVIKNFVFANTEVVIGHDSLVSDYCTLYPKVEICGDCKIGEKCIFGIGSIVLPKISVSANSKLDAGSILRKSILKSSLYSGNPAEIVTPKK